MDEMGDRRDACPTDILVTSPWVPIEWIVAHGFSPRGVWSLASFPTGAVAEGVCAFAQTARSWAELRPGTPAVFTTACDQMRRAADATPAAAHASVFLFNLPATWQTAAARRLYHAEVERLGKFLQRLGGHAPTNSELAAVMQAHEEKRTLLRRHLAHAPAPQAAAAMARFFNGEPIPEAVPASANHGVPLALVGGPLSAPQWGMFDLIASAGGCVALNATEPGERCLLPSRTGVAPVSGFSVRPSGSLKSETGATPVQRENELLTALCDHYFDHLVDVFQRPNSRLYAWLGARLAERKVRGIVLWVHVGCDLWRAEAASLREAFGLPVLVLDSPDVRGGGVRDLNRLAAFIESLHGAPASGPARLRLGHVQAGPEAGAPVLAPQ